MENVNIRPVRTEDTGELLKIYAPYVENTAISFEYEVPSIEEFRRRIETISKRYPYLVAETEAGKITGYCYCNEFKARKAYDLAVETTIYLREDMRGIGIGKKLYEKMEEYARLQNITNLYACIAECDIEDEHLTNASSRFHERLGYKLVGKFNKCGYKFDRWYDMVFMEKMIAEHEVSARPLIPFSKIMPKDDKSASRAE